MVTLQINTQIPTHTEDNNLNTGSVSHTDTYTTHVSP